MILKTLQYFHQAGETVEICAIGPSSTKNALWEGYASGKKGVVAGWFDDLNKAAEIVDKLNRIGAEGIYHTFNPCSEALLSRSFNRLKAGVDRTQDKEIKNLRWLLVDIDPKRPAGVSSTDKEHALALEQAVFIKGSLAGKGWPEDPMVGDSGNGAHLSYYLKDLENTPENVELLKYVLKWLGDQYLIRKDEILVEVDLKVFNPARISKIYGTTTRKGDHTEARPHRTARILELPKNIQPVSLDLLKAMALEAKENEEKARRPKSTFSTFSTARSTGSKIDLQAYLSHYAVPVKKVKENGTVTLHVIEECLFDSSHRQGEASIGQDEDGKLFYQCFHDSCCAKKWSEARQIISGADKLTPFMPDFQPGNAKKKIRKTDNGPKIDNQNSAEPGAEDNLEVIETMIQEINQNHAALMLGSKCVVMKESIDPIFDRPEISFIQVPDFKNFYANKKVLVGDRRGMKSVSIAKIWMESENRRQYQGIIFEPNQEKPGYYNLFRGFNIKPKKGDWALYKNHVKDVICNGDSKTFIYVMAWLSDMVKNPGKDKPGVSLVLQGGRGTGKGCFVYPFEKIIGSHFLHIVNQNQLAGRFNSHFKDALLVFCDEGFWAGDKSAEGFLKGIISEDVFLIEPKGKDAFKIKNRVRLIIASNEDWVIPAGVDERRFCVLKVSNKHMQDIQYFKPIWQQLNNGGIEAMLYDLLELNIGDYDLRNPPRTDALLEQIEAGMPSAMKFWMDRLKDECLITSHPSWDPYVFSEDLYNEYVVFSNKIGVMRCLDPRAFFKKIKEFVPSMHKNRIQSEKYGQRKWAYYFPTLEDCRKFLDHKLGIAVNWSENMENRHE